MLRAYFFIFDCTNTGVCRLSQVYTRQQQQKTSIDSKGEIKNSFPKST